MPFSRLIPLLLLVLALLGADIIGNVVPTAEAKVFDPRSFTLDNGLEVVVVTNRRAPIVTHMVWYKVGAADEPAGKSGIAHFLEHLMFKGTETTEPGEFSSLIARHGGRENAFTSYDYTAYHQTIAREHLGLVMRHEADRMANLVLNDGVVLAERDVILEERRSRVDNVPAAQLGEMVGAALYLNHPYRIPIIGWEHEMRGLTTEDALAFYRQWYAPNNAILIVAGDVRTDEVRALAEATYGKLAARPVPERIRPAEPAHHAPRRVTLRSPRAGQPSISIQFIAPNYGSGTKADAYALEVLDEIMGGGTTSRLYRSLVVRQGLAASAGSWYGPASLDLGSFGFYASPRPGIDADELEGALRAEIARLRRDGVTEQEVAAAKQRLVADLAYARDNLSSAPRILGRMLATGSTLDDVENWPNRIDAVTVEQVTAAARSALLDTRSVTGVLLPAAPSGPVAEGSTVEPALNEPM